MDLSVLCSYYCPLSTFELETIRKDIVPAQILQILLISDSDKVKYFPIYHTNNGILAHTLRFNRVSAIKINKFLYFVCHHVYYVYDITTFCVDAEG